ncbi:hypothetical protein [Macrococcoides caseolyticum]|uniref:DUF7365 family protein n=1 Tax=Macrococcoides caseolyticum TaxID=69966 RepID=UPI000C33A0E5|nr:hypothetical protein [Macrococcus caseolyticus]PKE22789.1 hypothetical protein CW688_01275 [Macrococcus caseolyticus]PKE34624.1 hypothetical protein CW668_00040 [Macrococcus caseolyticus]PKE36333.1 hypothetical protein CW695_03020 [Macrococcus caseolyticus]PKE36881.1 hypothetical protein CW695_00565 [Macrococcus caseolyticus]PKE45364.1 hypothetical protein CW666_02125 [Macrococcus caseolyticus]
MEDAILRWIVTVALPMAGFVMTVMSKSKENERRVTLVESKLEYLEKEDKNINTRLTNVENNYAILVRLDEQMKTLFNQNEEIKQEIKTIKAEKIS